MPVTEKPFMQLCTLNACSIKNKSAEFFYFVCESKADLIAITETWLTDNYVAARALATPLGYNLLDHPRSPRKGGGKALVFRDSLVVNKIAAAQIASFEYSDWRIKSGPFWLRLAITYRPPYSSEHPFSTGVFFDEFAEYLESDILSADTLFITGDFNIHVDADSPDANRFCTCWYQWCWNSMSNNLPMYKVTHWT